MKYTGNICFYEENWHLLGSECLEEGKENVDVVSVLFFAETDCANKIAAERLEVQGVTGGGADPYTCPYISCLFFARLCSGHDS
ncbi:hypothetical protein R1flu_024319 [Riccia fluitans]|uniref:Uncharacterized protein n=1 Tax=Riccia fluitans TaxID=41844 RepID=A0ABD1XUQ2_9MARC